MIGYDGQMCWMEVRNSIIKLWNASYSTQLDLLPEVGKSSSLLSDLNWETKLVRPKVYRFNTIY